MKNLLAGICLGLLLSACASSVIIPRVESRTLTIHESGRLAYNYCVKRSLFGKCKEWKIDFYDLSKPEDRVLLKDFRCINKLRKF